MSEHRLLRAERRERRSSSDHESESDNSQPAHENIVQMAPQTCAGSQGYSRWKAHTSDSLIFCGRRGCREDVRRWTEGKEGSRERGGADVESAGSRSRQYRSSPASTAAETQRTRAARRESPRWSEEVVAADISELLPEVESGHAHRQVGPTRCTASA